ncbi:hypothetical protein NPA09_00685 [Mycoplasmopsis equigenitalium]|uniref:Uncharacterized protein n=1 Tax=Mycoplasmopsis equigenitalium TaxID=114883 RepID=A0ABY5J1G5_9BACT|nr:hypothetical protein [Mycoplasmopsis equigenitalium]UUD37081.1 hypothetical protein NPA09_00685 [Mycoplasmopsis equigenitalium]
MSKIKNIKLLNIVPAELGKFLDLPFELKSTKTGKNFARISYFLKKEIELLKNKNNIQIEYNPKHSFVDYLPKQYTANLQEANFDSKELMFNIWTLENGKSNTFYSVFETGIINLNYMYSIEDLLADKDEKNVFLRSLFALTFNKVFLSDSLTKDFTKLSLFAKLNFVKEHINLLFLNYKSLSTKEQLSEYESLIFIKKRNEFLKKLNRIRSSLYSQGYLNKMKNATDEIIFKSPRRIDRPFSLSDNYSKTGFDSLTTVNTIIVNNDISKTFDSSYWSNLSIYKEVYDPEKWNDLAKFEKEYKGSGEIISVTTKCVDNEGYLLIDKENLYDIFNDKKDKEVLLTRSFIIFYNAIQSFRTLSDSIVYNLSYVEYDFYGLKNIIPILKYYKNRIKEFHLFTNDKTQFELKDEIYTNSEIEFKIDYCISALETKFALEDGKREKKKAINSGILQFTVLIFTGIAAFSVLYRFLGPGGNFELPYFVYWGPFVILVVLLTAALASYFDKKR